MEQATMIMMSVEDLRTIIREEVGKAVEKVEPKKELPHFLTRQEAQQLLRVSESKMFELMGRKDFPVCREFGVKIYTDKLFEWIEKNTPALEKKRQFRSIS